MMTSFRVGDRVRMHPGALTGLRRGKTFSSAELWALVVGGTVRAFDGAAVTVELPAESLAQLGKNVPGDGFVKVWSGYLVKIV